MCYITCVMFCYVMLYTIKSVTVRLYNIKYVITCVMLCFITFVMLCYITFVMLCDITCVMLCYITCVMLCYITYIRYVTLYNICFVMSYNICNRLNFDRICIFHKHLRSSFGAERKFVKKYLQKRISSI